MHGPHCPQAKACPGKSWSSRATQPGEMADMAHRQLHRPKYTSDRTSAVFAGLRRAPERHASNGLVSGLNSCMAGLQLLRKAAMRSVALLAHKSIASQKMSIVQKYNMAGKPCAGQLRCCPMKRAKDHALDLSCFSLMQGKCMIHEAFAAKPVQNHGPGYSIGVSASLCKPKHFVAAQVDCIAHFYLNVKSDAMCFSIVP